MSDGPKKPELKPGMSFAQLQSLEKAWHDSLPQPIKDVVMGASLAATMVAASTAHSQKMTQQMVQPHEVVPMAQTSYESPHEGLDVPSSPAAETEEPSVKKMREKLQNARMKGMKKSEASPASLNKLDPSKFLKDQGLIWSIDHQGNSLCPSCAVSEKKNPQTLAAHKPKKQFIVEPGEVCENCGEKS